MSAASELPRAVTAPGAAARPTGTLGRVAAPPLAPFTRRAAARLADAGLARVAWTVGRTGRPGIVGIALLLAAGVFLVSTHLPVAAEVEALRNELPAARGRARPAAPERVADPAAALRALPGRAEMPAILRQLFEKATQARLAIDSGKYDVSAAQSGGVVRYRIALPVTGPYPQIRAFLDATLATMPAVALSELALERKSIAEGNVQADIGMTVYTAATGAGAAPGPAAAKGRPGSDRVVAPAHASALFAQHSWYVLPPAPPPAPPAPPPDPTAPPLPFTFLGSFSPGGEPPVYFLARGDRVVDARVGDRLDGVYQLESAAGGQLVFVYLPLNVRQSLAAGVAK